MQKTLIKNTAELLIHANGTTSTLEVKNYLYSKDPSTIITQREVSATMSDLFNEGTFARNMVNENGFNFYRYELANVVNRPAGAINYPKGFGLLAINDGNFVCYVSGRPQLYAQGPDRNTARKECYKKYKNTGVKWDNINTCSVGYYNKKLA